MDLARLFARVSLPATYVPDRTVMNDEVRGLWEGGLWVSYLEGVQGGQQ